MLEVYPWLGTILMPNNIGHAGGFPLALKGIDETRIEGWAPGAKDLGGLGTDIT